MRWNFAAFNRLLSQFEKPWYDASALGGLPIFGFVLLALLSTGNITLFYKLLAAFCIGLFVAFAIRLVFPKPRPGKSAAEFRALLWYERFDASSFPSVHALRASILSFYFYEYYPSSASFALALFAVAVVSYSRVFLKKHYFADVVAGALVGLLCGVATLRLFS